MDCVEEFGKSIEILGSTTLSLSQLNRNKRNKGMATFANTYFFAFNPP